MGSECDLVNLICSPCCCMDLKRVGSACNSYHPIQIKFLPLRCRKPKFSKQTNKKQEKFHSCKLLPKTDPLS